MIVIILDSHAKLVREAWIMESPQADMNNYGAVLRRIALLLLDPDAIS